MHDLFDVTFHLLENKNKTTRKNASQVKPKSLATFKEHEESKFYSLLGLQ